jgi:hypothetical protein
VWEFWEHHILANIGFNSPFHFSHSGGSWAVFLCNFDLPFPEDKWCWLIFHMLISYLNIFFGKMSIRIFCLFLLGCLSFYFWVLWILFKKGFRLYWFHFIMVFRNQSTSHKNNQITCWEPWYFCSWVSFKTQTLIFIISKNF